VDGYATGSFEELKLRLGRYPAGTAFRWCPRVGSAFEDFSPGQRDDMYKELVADAAKRSQIVEPYAAAKCGER
jgi:hypothetical protein